LKTLYEKHPDDRELTALLKYETALLKFDGDMDKWEIEAHPEKYPEKYKALIEFINYKCAPIIQEYDPWALAEKPPNPTDPLN
jgi:hypothetical protein